MTLRQRTVALLLALVALADLTFASPAQNSELAALVSKGARNVHTATLESPAVTQLSYDVQLKYPQMAISKEKLQSLKQQEWRQCAIHKAQWEHFGDEAVKPPRLIHQYLTSFARKDEYMVIAMRYVSALPSSSESKPDNNAQHVYVIHYDLSADEVRRQMGEEANACLKDR